MGTPLSRDALNTIIEQLKTNDPTLTAVECKSMSAGKDSESIESHSHGGHSNHGDHPTLCRCDTPMFEQAVELPWRLGSPGKGVEGSNVVDHLSESLSMSTYISNLDLNGCGIRCAGTTLLCPSLPAQLTRLVLSSNYIGNAGCVAIGAWLTDKAFQLEELRLRGNRIEDQGAADLSEGLSKCQRLKILDLGENQLEDAGAEALAAQLRLCPALEELDLSFNAIADDAAPAMAELITTLPTLTTLNLNYNAISTKGSKILAQGAHDAGLRCEVSLGFNMLVVSQFDNDVKACDNLRTISRFGVRRNGVAPG